MISVRQFKTYVKVIGFIIFLYLLLLVLFYSPAPTSNEERDAAIELRVFKTHFLTTPFRNAFQIVSGTSLVFSAYRELRDSRLITVLGLSSWRRNDPQEMYCNLIDAYYNITLSVHVAAIYFLDSQYHLLEEKLIPLIIACPLPHSYFPNWISISVDTSGFGMNMLDIVTNRHEGDHLSVAVCTPPLVGTSFSGDAQVIEWIEMYRLLGVSLFVMYTTKDRKIRQKFPVIDHYVSAGIIDLVEMTSMDPSSLEEVTSSFVVTECRYRVMRRYEWIVVSEFDSVLMPQNTRTRLQQVILSVQKSSGTGGLQAFKFPTAWFLRKEGNLIMNVSLYRRRLMDVFPPWGMLLKSEHGVVLSSDKLLLPKNLEAEDVAPIAKYCVYREQKDVQIGEIEYDDTARMFMPAILRRLEILRRKMRLNVG